MPGNGDVRKALHAGVVTNCSKKARPFPFGLCWNPVEWTIPALAKYIIHQEG
jgi:hypothetical protein